MLREHYGERLFGIGSCFGYGKYVHKVRDCPSVVSIGRKGNQVPLNALEGDDPKRSISMQSGLEEQRWMMMMMMISYSILFFMSSFYVGEYG